MSSTTSRPARWYPGSAYHEAGHAVAHWQQNWPLRYVSMRPRTKDAFGRPAYNAVTRSVQRRASKPETMLACMRIAASGEIASQRRARNRPDERQTLAAIRNAAAGRPGAPDMATFVDAAAKYDQLAGLGSQGGPESWLRIWLGQAEQIGGPLWPAVLAVSDELIYGRGTLTKAEVWALCSTALQTGPQA